MCAYTEKEGKECSFTVWMLPEGLHNPKEGKTIKLPLKLKENKPTKNLGIVLWQLETAEQSRAVVLFLVTR